MIRHEVEWFAGHMDRKLLENAHKNLPDGTPAWKLEKPMDLLAKMTEEMLELAVKLQEWDGVNEERRRRIIGESADVANFAMMIADVVHATSRS